MTAELLRYQAVVPEHTASSQRGPVPSETDSTISAKREKLWPERRY
jgi:hypothetical protein